MIVVSEVFAKDFKSIQEIANIAWTDTYETILSKAQIEYMLELFYSDDALLKNLNDGHHFLLAAENSTVKIKLDFTNYIYFLKLREKVWENF